MVLANDNIRNGRRSRGPSPEQGSDSEEEAGEKIRVGKEYQAVIPPIIPPNERKLDQQPDRALLVWSPTSDIPDQSLDHYINVAKERYGYNGEQALGMLFWHKHSLENAINDLPNFTPFPDEWTLEDKVLFEQAFQFHGKSFHRIRQMLPDKSIATLVKHYYSWKKTRNRTSLMDKHARKLARQGEEGAGSDAGSEVGSNTDSDSEEKKWIHLGKSQSPSSHSPQSSSESTPDKDGTESKVTCNNCGVVCTIAQSTSKGLLCNSCYLHWRRTGSIRPTVGPARPKDRHANSVLARSKRKPPKGMYINHDDLVSLSSSSGPAGTGGGGQTGAGAAPTLQPGDALLKSMDRDIVALKRQPEDDDCLAVLRDDEIFTSKVLTTHTYRASENYQQVQANKQALSSVLAETAEGLGDLRPTDNNSRINARWTNEEMLLAVQGIRMHGKDFSTIAEIIGTKTEAHVRSFYANQRKRYNLDKVVQEYEEEHGPILDTDIKMETESTEGGGGAGGSAPASPSAPTKQPASKPATPTK